MSDNFEQLSENIDLNLFPENLNDQDIIYPIDDSIIPSGELEVGWSWIPQSGGIFNWTDGNNWSGPVAGGYPNNLISDAATINSTLSENATINLNQNINLSRLILSSNSNTYGFSINGGSPSGLLTVATGIIFNPIVSESPYGYGIHNINCNIDIASTNVFFIAGKTSNTFLNFNGIIKPTSGSNKTLIVSNSNPGTIAINGSLVDNGTNRLSFTKSSSTLNKVYLSNSNTYTGQTTIIGSNNSPLYFNSIENINSTNPSSFGKPILANEQILIGLNTTGGYISYNGTSHSSNRSFLLRHYIGISTFEVSSSGTLILNGVISTYDGTGSTDAKTLRFSGIGTGYFPSIPFHPTGITNVEKLGIGKWIFSDKNYYLGITKIGGGILQFSKRLSLYSNQAGTDIILPFWSKSKIYTVRDTNATLAMNVGGSGEFTSANISTLLTNLGGDIPTSSGGLTRKSYWGFDTTNSPSGIFNLTQNITNTSGSYGGAIGLRKLGSNTLLVSGTNTYTHDTIIDSGTIQLGNINALGSSASPTIINNSGTLDLNAYTINKTGTITINSGTIANGSVTGSCSYVFDNAISNAVLGGTGSLTKTGSGTLTIQNNTNTYSGSTSINGGTIEINSISNVGVPGTLGTGASIFTNWKPDSAFSSPKISYTGSGDYSTNKTLYNFSTVTTIENNSASGSISFDGPISAFRPKRETFLSQIGSTLSAWLPADPANNKPDPYLWSANVFRLTSSTNYVSAETLASLVPSVADPNNPPETFLFNNFNEIIDLLKVQTGVAELSLGGETPNIYWKNYPSGELILGGSSKSSKNALRLQELGSAYTSPDPLPIVKTGSGTWTLRGYGDLNIIPTYYFPIQHKEGTLIIDGDTINNEFTLGDTTNNYKKDINLLINKSDQGIRTLRVLSKNNLSKQKTYIGSNKNTIYCNISYLYINREITLFSNSIYFEIYQTYNSYGGGYPANTLIDHPINIGIPDSTGVINIYQLKSSKSININFGSLLIDAYTYIITSDSVYINHNASLMGNGHLNGNVKGVGNICPLYYDYNPYSGPFIPIKRTGLLIIKSVDPSDGTNFHFRFTETNLQPSYDGYGKIITNNDVLCLSQADPYLSDPPDGITDRLSANLSQANEINLYFPSSIENGQVYEGGFLIQDGSDILTKLSNATYNLYIKTDSGNIVYNGQNYALLNSNYSVTIGSKFYAQFALFPASSYGDPPGYISAYLSTFTINVA